MPTYRMHMINENFEASDEFDAEDAERARQMALKSALDIGLDEVTKGKKLFAAEVRVEAEGQLAARFIATVGASPLIGEGLTENP
jgi:hypothetical protein